LIDELCDSFVRFRFFAGFGLDWICLDLSGLGGVELNGVEWIVIG